MSQLISNKTTCKINNAKLLQHKKNCYILPCSFKFFYLVPIIFCTIQCVKVLHVLPKVHVQSLCT